MTRAPLSGITVVTLEQAVSAPMCTRTLADFGARVIKVEHPNGGDFARHYDDVVNGLAAHFVWCNRNKESVTLDLKTTEGLDILHRLLDRADVLVSNLAPGSTGRLGITPADMEARHPNVIAVEIDGYGPGGPLSHKRAYDLLIQAESGTCAVTGEAGAPAKPGPARRRHHDRAAVGAIDHGAAVFAGHRPKRRRYRRRRQPVRHHDGRDGLPAHLHPALGHRPAAAGHELTGRGAVRVVSAPPTARQWCSARPTTANGSAWHEKSCSATTWPTTSGSERTPAGWRTGRCSTRRSAIWCAQHDLDHVQKTADAAGIGNSRYNVPSEVVVHPQLTARDRWRTVSTSAGRYPGAAAAAGHRRLRSADGRGARARRAHRRRARRTRRGLRRDWPAARRRRDRAGVRDDANDEPCCCRPTTAASGRLTLNRPDRKNAINAQLWVELADALRAAARD